MAWVKGKSGNPDGRPKGAKDKLTNIFWTDVFTVWQSGGRTALSKVMTDDPSTFVRVVASLMPKEMDITHRRDIVELTDEEIAARIAELRGVGTSDGDDAQKVDPSQLN